MLIISTERFYRFDILMKKLTLHDATRAWLNIVLIDIFKFVEIQIVRIQSSFDVHLNVQPFLQIRKWHCIVGGIVGAAATGTVSILCTTTIIVIVGICIVGIYICIVGVVAIVGVVVGSSSRKWLLRNFKMMTQQTGGSVVDLSG